MALVKLTGSKFKKFRNNNFVVFFTVVVFLLWLPASAVSRSSSSSSSSASASSYNVLRRCFPGQSLFTMRRSASTVTTAPHRRMSSRGATAAEKQKQQASSSSLSRDPIYLWSSLVAGVGSGALASILCAPLDLIRTRMQVWGQVMGGSSNIRPSATAIPLIFRDILAREGWTGLFRGLGATLVTVPAFWGVYFPLYDESKRQWKHHSPESNPALIHMGSAVFAGAMSDLICNPMFVVRTRLQTEALHYKVEHHALVKPGSIHSTIRALYRESGGSLAIFWRGMSANLFGLSHVAVQFPAYEYLKSNLRRRRRQQQNQENDELSAVDFLIASAASKMTASVLTYPHEVVRARMMDSRRMEGLSLIQTCRHIYKAEGFLGFYAGLPVSLVRVLPSTCLTFLAYEVILQLVRTNFVKEKQ